MKVEILFNILIMKMHQLFHTNKTYKICTHCKDYRTFIHDTRGVQFNSKNELKNLEQDV